MVEIREPSYVSTEHLLLSSLLFVVLEKKLFIPYFCFFSLRVWGTLFLFLLFLFGLLARSALYHSWIFYIMAFFSPMLEHVLYKIYDYIILKHVARISGTRRLFNSKDKHTNTNISVGARILELWHILI